MADLPLTDKAPAWMARLQGTAFVRSLALFVAAGVLLYFGAVLWSGWSQTVDTLHKLGIPVLLAGSMLAASAFVWRFARWHYALSCFGYRIPRWNNLLVYLSGLALTTSPGKLGETFRSVLLLPYTVRLRHSLAAFVADRLSDVLGMCLLGVLAGGLLRSWWLALALIGLTLSSLLAAHALLHPASGRLWTWLAGRLRGLPVHGGQAALESWALLWTPGRLAAFSAVAVLAYGSQALVFAWFCHLAGIAVPVADAVVIFVHATLFGAASMIPGGLGAMEAALVLQLVQRGAEEVVAIAVSIGIRLVTLWLGIALGMTALALYTRLHADTDRPKP